MGSGVDGTALAAFDQAAYHVRAGVGLARTVAAGVGFRELDRRTGAGHAARTRADPGDRQAALALQEPLRAHATRGPTLRRVLRERGDLDGLPGGGDHHRLAVLVVVGAQRAEVH